MKYFGAVCVFFVFHLAVLSSAAPPSAPPPPKSYDIKITYRINAFRNERLLQYYEMLRFLKKAGFQRDPEEAVPESEPEDVKSTRMSGTIPSGRARRLLNERHIRSIQLMPHGAKLPDDKATRVRVEIELFNNLVPEEQYRLHGQTFEVLAGLSFFEAAGYDHRGYTRLVGSMPLARVDALLSDLRTQPAGKKLPGPFRNVWAVRASVVNPDMPPPAPRPRPPKVPRGQEKLSPDLRDVLNDAAAAAKPMRLEVILAGVPSAEDKSFIPMLRGAAAGLIVEGRLGPLVTVAAKPSQATALAALPEVIGVRLPRLPQPASPDRRVAGPTTKDDRRDAGPTTKDDRRDAGPTTKDDRRDAGPTESTRWRPLLDASGAARLQAMGRNGRGTRLAVVDSDFRGWEKLVGKGLPAETRIFDLTSERNADLLPDAFPAGEEQGSGTRHALTIAHLAPGISLTLIRIDPASPYMLEAVARAINGDLVRSLNLESRLAEIQLDQDILDKRRDKLIEERRQVLNAFAVLDEQAKRLLKQAEDKDLTPEQVEKIPGFKKLIERDRTAILYKVRQRIYDRDARAFHQRQGRYLKYKKDLFSLRGIRVVASAVVWHDGFPVDGTSPLSRYFDDRPFRAALWFQAAGDTRGQSWAGLFRDADGNGIMEFGDPHRLPPDLWSPELSFLAWQTPKAKASDIIPAGTRLRLSLQWREAHDPLYAQTGEDPYRQPLARNMRIFLLRQLDPSGKRQPTDDLEIVAQSVDAGYRLNAAPSSATYEISLDVQIKQAGRFAVRVGGRAPDSIYPPGDPTLPVMRKRSELRVRLFVSPLDASGRAVFQDYVTAAGSIGMPADARTVITVGAADARNRRRPYSGGGAPFGMELMSKPDVLSYDRGEGTAESAAFAAGLAALAPLADQEPTAGWQSLHIPPGGMLRLPRGSPDR